MIESTLNNLKKYLEFKFDEAGNNCKVHLDTLKKDEEPEFGVYITLMRIEEETSIKKQNIFHRDSDKTGHYANPDLCVNLYVLISVFAEDYPSGLSCISFILNVLNSINDFSYMMSSSQLSEYGASLDDAKKECYEAIKSQSIELQNLSAEQTNSLWQTLGTKIVPAACYKIRMLTITDDANNVSAPIVENVDSLPMGTFKERMMRLLQESADDEELPSLIKRLSEEELESKNANLLLTTNK